LKRHVVTRLPKKFSPQISKASSCKNLPRFVRQSKYLNLVIDIFRVRTRTVGYKL
jgi:hypothetical protein